MKNVVHAFHRLFDQLAIGHRSLDEGVLESVEIMPIAGAQVVEDPDFLRGVLIVFDDVRTDESGPAGDEDFHGEVKTVRGFSTRMGSHDLLHLREFPFDRRDERERVAAAVGRNAAEGSGLGQSPSSRFTETNASTTRSRSSRVCAALIWVRMRALPCGTTG